MLVDVCHDFVNRIDEDTVALAGIIAVVVQFHHLAVGIGLQHQVAVHLPLLAVEVDVDAQSRLGTARRLR